MGDKIITSKGGSIKSGERGSKIYTAHRLSPQQKNAAIKPKKKQKKVRV